ncbi:MAG: stage II sporulation protein M [Bacteroidota bacterium]
MRESKFIEQNKEKWIGFERLLKADKKDPDKLSEFFLKITDDLSYARTFYNNRFIRLYLNNICQQLFYLIYKSPKKKAGKAFISFWKYELPTIAYESRKELLVALLVFSVSVTIGVISSIHDPDFVRIILGDEYVEMTIENIEGGDPMAVYKKMNEMDMFFGITLNNLLVSIKTFLLGILWAAGSIIILLYNGIMVGAFQYFFIEKGLFWDSFLTIWLHGTLEMSAIVIAGASGIVLGKGIIAPESYSRLQAFQIAAKRGAKLFLGIVPIIVTAAIIESFLTRYTNVPDTLRLILIILSLGFILFYFVWYPKYVVKSGNAFSQPTSDLQDSPDFTIRYRGIIKSGGEILRDTFLFYRKFGVQILRINFWFSISYLLVVGYAIYPSLELLGLSYNYGDWIFELSGEFFNYQKRPYLIPINSVFFVAHSLFIIRFFYQDINQVKLSSKSAISFFILSALFSMGLSATDLMGSGLNFIVSILVSPITTLALFIFIQEEKMTVGKLISRIRLLIKGKYGFLLGVSFLITMISVAGYFFFNSPFPLFYMDFVNWNVQLDPETLNFIAVMVNSFFSMFTTLITLPIYIIGVSLCYFSLKEIQEADHLKEQIEQLK